MGKVKSKEKGKWSNPNHTHSTGRHKVICPLEPEEPGNISVPPDLS